MGSCSTPTAPRRDDVRKLDDLLVGYQDRAQSLTLDVTNPEQIKHAVDTDTRRTHPRTRELHITQSAECAIDGVEIL
jgi:hypothetical protein